MSAATNHAPFCRANFHYADPGTGEGTAPAECEVFDGRGAGLPGWEVCGFELRRHRTAVADFDDDEAIARVHYPELSELARAMTGCDHALIASHIKRNPQQAESHPDLAPICYVHSDFAPSYLQVIHAAYAAAAPPGGEGPTGDNDDSAMDATQAAGQDAGRTLAQAGLQPAQVAGAKRTVILQFWRNLGAPRNDLPIAFCDTRTVDRADVHPFPVHDYAGGGVDFETLGIGAPKRSGSHRWYTFPDMTRDEVVAFRTFDTDMARAGQPFWTPHSAFRDPRVAVGQPPRSSIELRATCLFL